jgi:hypothetical protein
MVPNKSIDEYNTYEKKARDETLMKTALYIALKAKYDALMAKFLILQEEVRVLRIELKTVQDQRAELRIKQKLAEEDTVLATGQRAAKSNSIREMSGQIGGLEAKAGTAEQTRRTVEAQVVAAKSVPPPQPPSPPQPPPAPACDFMWADQMSFEIQNVHWRRDFPDTGAKWIWNIPDAGNHAPSNTVLFQKKLHLPRSTNAALYVLVDNYSVVYINDRLLGKTSGGWGASDPWQVFPVSLTAGACVVTIICTNAVWHAANPAGLRATLIDSSNGQPLAHTDRSWLWTMHTKAPSCAQ